jgi:two-component system response regulator MprA
MLQLDPIRKTVTSGGVSVALTQTEYRILGALAGRPGETLRRVEIVGAAWPAGAIVSENTIDAYIARLRRKLRSLPAAPEIVTARGVGYTLR